MMTTMRRLIPLLVLFGAACSEVDGAPARRDAADGEAAAHDAETHDAGARDHSMHAVADATVASGAITSGSVYNLLGEWWDATGERALLRRLAGRPQVIAMVYTSCPQACPAILAEMKRVEAALGPDVGDVGFVLASIDSEHDTPEKLAEFARRAGLDPARWTLLGAQEGDVLELAAVLGVQYRRLPDGEFAHANVLTVLDSNGEIVHQQLGLGEGTGATANAARNSIPGR